MAAILSVKELEKSYRDKKVIHKITFDVNKGEILGFLGPNGAGKSTTINILTGALGFDSGMVTYMGESIFHNILDYKNRIGVVPQDLALYEDLSAWKNVHFFASLYGLRGRKLDQQCEYALQFAGLTDRAKEKVKTFSGGMKRRLNIACAIAHEPELLIMDEPTVGIDPQSRNYILSSIKELRKKGMTVLYTTHYMEEVEEIATRIIIMDKGAIIAGGTKEELKESIARDKQVLIETDRAGDLDLDLFYNIVGVKHVEVKDDKIELTTLKGIENLDKIITAFIQSGAKINNISCKTASLETVFLKLTGKSLRD